MLSSLFSFKGRITRRRLALSLCGGLFAYAILAAAFRRVEPLDSLTTLAFLWFLAAGFWKRAQDAGWPGIFGILLNFIFFVAGGTDGPNAYGPDPRKPFSPTVPTTPMPRIEAWERARKADEPKVRTVSFKCGACGAQNANIEYQGTACCQFCGAPKE